MYDSFIHLFTTPGGYYLYDVNKNVILNLLEEQYKFIYNQQNGTGINIDLQDIDKQTAESIEYLYKQGFLSSKRPKEMYHPVNDTLISHLNNKVKMITLQITRQCNLRCKYCVYSGEYENRKHENVKMSFETAKKGMDFLVKHSIDNENIFLAFYGGEPLIEFEFIKKCIEYFEDKAEGKKIHLTLTTNATLINEEIIEYFQKHDVHMLISLDGPAEIHNKNRVFSDEENGTFEQVMEKVELIKKNYPQYLDKCVSFNAVLDPQNDFGCVNQFFTDFDMAKESNLMYSEIARYYKKGDYKILESYISQLKYEHFKLFLSELGYLEKKYTSKLVWRHYSQLKDKFDKLGVMSELPDKVHHSGPCVPGVQRLFMDANGNFYPCERVSETSSQMKIGNVDFGFDVDRIKNLLNIGKISEKNCTNCWAFRFCSLCAASADDQNKLSGDKKISNCSAVRKSAENLLKDICTLREFGDEFKRIPSYELTE